MAVGCHDHVEWTHVPESLPCLQAVTDERGLRLELLHHLLAAIGLRVIQDGLHVHVRPLDSVAISTREGHRAPRFGVMHVGQLLKDRYALFDGQLDWKRPVHGLLQSIVPLHAPL